MIQRIMFTLLFFLAISGSLFSQVPVDVNSGNLRFPFPQFLAYENKDASLDLATTPCPNPQYKGAAVPVL